MNDNKGWTCPSCKRGVSPNEKTCDHGGKLSFFPATAPAVSPTVNPPDYPPSPTAAPNGGWGWPNTLLVGGIVASADNVQLWN